MIVTYMAITGTPSYLLHYFYPEQINEPLYAFSILTYVTSLATEPPPAPRAEEKPAAEPMETEPEPEPEVDLAIKQVIKMFCWV